MRICKRCGNSFTPHSKNQQVCDSPHFKQCIQCEKDYPWERRGKTCSSQCAADLRQQAIGSVDKACAFCGESFITSTPQAKFCDREHTLDCVVCQQTFTIKQNQLSRPPRTCSQSCASKLSHTDVSEKKRQANSQKKYGTDFPTQSPEFKVKVAESVANSPVTDHRFGSENFTKNVQEKFGVQNVSQADSVKVKKRETTLANYGVENPMQDASVRGKMQDTMVERHGVRHSLQSDTAREKMRETMMQRHGVATYLHGKINFLHLWEDLENWLRMLAGQTVEETEAYLAEVGADHLALKNSENRLILSSVAEFFNVHPLTLLKKKKRFGLDSIFARAVISQKEDAFEAFLEANHPEVKVVRNSRKQIAPKELDFFFPDLKFAVEISPTSTHFSELDDMGAYIDGAASNEAWASAKLPEYHLNKFLACQEQGIELITVFDWMPWEKVLEMVSHKIQGTRHRYPARKLQVHTVRKKSGTKLSKELKNLVNDWHVLGFTGRGADSYTYLTDAGGEILAVSAWGKPRQLNIRKSKKDKAEQLALGNNSNASGTVSPFDERKNIELVRMCFRPGVAIPGGASKMLKNYLRFEQSQGTSVNKVMTFSDNDLGYGNVYSALGFHQINSPVAGKNYVHISGRSQQRDRKAEDALGASGNVFRIKDTSLHLAGADRLLQRFPGYVEVGTECSCTDAIHLNGECLPNNVEIVRSYGFVEVFDCGYTKWEFTAR